MRILRALCLSLSLAASAPALAGDPVLQFAQDDPAMNSAMADARRTLPLFYGRLAQTDLDSEVMLLKVAMPYKAGGAQSFEHIWVAVASREGDSFRGVFANDPVHIDYDQYDPVQFTEDDISDWMYYDKAGLMQGAFTMRVMLKDLPAGQAAEFRRALAPPPEGTGPYE
jgi:uncharacterized protein YegJ (DUF2314 family)